VVHWCCCWLLGVVRLLWLLLVVLPQMGFDRWLSSFSSSCFWWCCRACL
jgi:hypothetical protein